MNSAESARALVVVTGAAGFIALHCIRALLSQGYRVRGTVRTLSNEAAIRKAVAPLASHDAFSLMVANLTEDRGWDEVFAGAQYAMHVASPVPNAPPKDEADIIRPACEGTVRVLSAAYRAGVRRVVLTSSTAAIMSARLHDTHIFNETDWSDLRRKMGAYEKSKTLAERAAWEFVRALPADRPMALVSMNPAYVLGPSLIGKVNTSNEIVGKLLRRELLALPRMHFGLVDVRDVASAHIAALTAEQAAGERFILMSDTAWMKEIAQVLASAGYSVVTREAPNLAVRLMSLLDPTVKLILDEIGMPFRATAEKAKTILGWSGRTMREMVLDTARCMSAESTTNSPRN